MSDKVTSLVPANAPLKPGVTVRLKAGSPAMTVSKIETIVICTYFDVNTGSFAEAEFALESLEIDAAKVNQSKFNSFA